jgi:hypothetical protein
MSPAQRRNAFLFVLCVALLLSMPLINGFPFTYPDTGTYLRSAFRGYVPYDRPFWYGLFIRISSLGGSTLWGPVVVQAALCAFVLLRTLRYFAPAQTTGTVAVVAVLCACTGVSWYAGQLMPDIFTGIGLLALLLLLLDDASRPLRSTYAALVVLAVLVHASNLLTFTLLTAFALVVLRSVPVARRRDAVLLVLACWPLLVALTAVVTGKAEPGRGSHVFLTARLIDAGILNDWLDAHCPDGSGLCDHRAAMPANANDFLWAPTSPLYAMGGWEAPPDDYRAVVHSALSEPEFLMRFVGNSLKGALLQLVDLHVGAGFIGRTLQDPKDPVHDMVRNTMEQDFPAFITARQATGDGNGAWVAATDKLFAPVMGLCHVALVLLLLLRPRHLSAQWRSAALLVLAALAANALVCATLSMVADRFGSRMNWVVPLLVLVALMHWTAARRSATA